MSETNDGGRAFPAHVQYLHAGGTGDEYFPGMSLRAWLSGQALDGYLSGRNNIKAENPSNFVAERVAKDCCRYADALIAELERRTE